MVSLSSLFGGKKKSKSRGTIKETISQPVPTSNAEGSKAVAVEAKTDVPMPTAAPSSSVASEKPSGPGRFGSIRGHAHKIASSRNLEQRSANGHAHGSIGSSSELNRRRSVRDKKNGLAGLPELDFGPQLGPEGDGGSKSQHGNSLGLNWDSTDRWPRLSKAEVRKLRDTRFGCEEIRAAWDIFGTALKATGCETPGLLQKRSYPGLSLLPSQYYLLALFFVSVQPTETSAFPSLSNRTTPQAPATPSPRATLDIALKDESVTAVGLVDILKFVLHRLDPSAQPLIDKVLYTKFVQAEHASSYPLDAYDMLFRPRLPLGVGAYLDGIFEIWVAIVNRAERNGAASGKLSLLLGWWVWGHSTKKVEKWEAGYDDWKEAGRRVEHLFYAWIRLQASKRDLPHRLLQLVDRYPFGQSSHSMEHLPAPPPSSFPRQTLHVKLESHTVLSRIKLTPSTILESFITGQFSESSLAPTASRLRETIAEDAKFAFVNHDSKAYLSIFSAPPPVSPVNDESPVVEEPDGPLYRPFNTISSARTSPNGHARRRSQSYGDVQFPSSQYLPSSRSLLTEWNGTNVQPSSSRPDSLKVQTPSEVDNWDDFQKSGFGNASSSSVKLDLALSPTISNSPRTPRTPNSLSQSRPEIPLKCMIVAEEILQLDDMFLPFTQDLQLDPASASWPPFVVVRLAEPFFPDQGAAAAVAASHSQAHPIEWLLLSVSHNPSPHPLPAPSRQGVRSVSPSGASSVSRRSSFGIKDLATSFKRSASLGIKQGGLRRNMFGTNRALSSSSNLEPLSEDSIKTPSTALAPPVEVTSTTTAAKQDPVVTPIVSGEEVSESPTHSPPAAALPEQAASLSPPSSGANEPPSLSHANDNDNAAAEAEHSHDLADSSLSDWTYVAEGGAHVVFGYRGVDAQYLGQALRLAKVAEKKEWTVDPEAKQVWRDELLPKLLPAHLLPSTRALILSRQWAEALVHLAEEYRPASRGKIALPEGETVRATLMEDLRASSGSDANRTTFSVEIKPKWGFLPNAKYVYPPEAASIKAQISRYRLHQFYRDPEDDTGYDPLDLFSGDAARMRQAFASLWIIWERSNGAANNWRVYVDGKTVSDPSDLSQFGEDKDTLIASNHGGLLRSSGVLDLLRLRQSALDATDISDLAKRYAEEYPDSELFDPINTPEATPDELREFVAKYLTGSRPSAGAVDAVSSSWTLREALIAYSLSAIFKDCSIFVKAVLHRPSAEEKWSLDGSASTVKVIDLDLKPIQSMRHWFELDDKLWRHWLSEKTSPDPALSSSTGTGQPGTATTPTSASGSTSSLSSIEQTNARGTVNSSTVPPFTPAGRKSAFPAWLDKDRDNASTTGMYAPSPSASSLTNGTPAHGRAAATDSASVMAMYVPTPDRSRSEKSSLRTHGEGDNDSVHETPKESSAPVEEDDGLNNGLKSLSMGDPDPSEAPIHREQDSLDPVEVVRRQRSFAPSPSPAPEPLAEQPQQAPGSPVGPKNQQDGSAVGDESAPSHGNASPSREAHQDQGLSDPTAGEISEAGTGAHHDVSEVSPEPDPREHFTPAQNDAEPSIMAQPALVASSHMEDATLHLMQQAAPHLDLGAPIGAGASEHNETPHAAGPTVEEGKEA